MEQRDNTFWMVAGGIFFGGLSLVLFVTFWQIALIGLVALVFIWGLFASEGFRNVVGSLIVIALAVWFFQWREAEKNKSSWRYNHSACAQSDC